MATAKIRVTKRDQNKILQAFYVDGRSRKVIERKIRREVAEPRKIVTQYHVDEAMESIKRNLQDGLEQSGTVSTWGGASYSYFFTDLSEHTKKRKKGRIGEGKFWLDRGTTFKGRMSLRAAMAAIPDPKVTYRTRLVAPSKRRGDNRIDFELVIRISEMDYPLDEMVRRPFLTGEPTLAISGDYSTAKIDVLAMLEYGVTSTGLGASIPGRPWISGFAAKVGNVIYDDLINPPSIGV